MKRIFIINAVMVLLSVTAFSQSTIKISELPLHSGNPNGGYAPISIGGVTKKFNIGTFVWTGGTYSNPTWLTSISPSKLLQGGAAIGQILKWNGSNWVPSDFSGATGTAGGHLLGTYPNPSVNWSFGYTTYDVRYQPLDGDLTSIAGLMGTSGILRKTAANTWYLDVNSNYISDVDTAAMLDPYLRKSALDNSSSYKDTFSVNPTITGTTFGKYPDNSTPNWVGMTAREAIVDAITNCIHPTYYSPTTGLQVSSSAGYTWAGGSGSVFYEIGTNMGDITLSEYSYIPNDAGIKDSLWGYANGNKVSMPYTVGSLNTAQSFYVKLYYAEGICKTDNCGNTDCYGKILAGNVNSPTLTLQPYYLKFFGAAAALPNTSSQVRALPNQSYNTGATTITLNTGTTYTDFIVALPQGKTITGVIDETALNANITSSYVLTGTISVNDAGGTARTYNLYQMSIGSPYAVNHVHKITHN